MLDLVETFGLQCSGSGYRPHKSNWFLAWRTRTGISVVVSVRTLKVYPLRKMPCARSAYVFVYTGLFFSQAYCKYVCIRSSGHSDQVVMSLEVD